MHRILTQSFGLVSAEMFDAVELEAMVFDAESQDFIPADGEQPEAYSVRVHLAKGGVDTVQDFSFDPSEPGADERAKAHAQQYGLMIADIIKAANPDLELSRILYTDFAEAHADWVSRQ